MTVKKNDLHRLQAIAEAAARIAEELGQATGAKNIRAVNAAVDSDLGQSVKDWDDYGAVNEWLSEIKYGAHNPIMHKLQG